MTRAEAAVLGKACAMLTDACPDHVFMDVASFHFHRGEPIPLKLAGHGTGVHIERDGPGKPTWHYITDCDETCPK